MSLSNDVLASFSDETDIAEWINTVLDGDLQRRDGHGAVSELATRLEVACQNTASQLEQSIDDISRAVPRLTYDLHFLRESALSLKLALSTLQTRLSSSTADDETTQALQRLSYLDIVKSGMEASKDVLREAESWSTLESEVTALLAEPNYEKAAERLADASKSMVVFQNTPEYDTRRALMVSLQNQLEAALSSALVAAINAHDVISCKDYYSIFAHIQRESEFRNYYNGSRRTALLQLWSKAVLSDVEGESPQADEPPFKFAEFLSRFFAEFLALVDEERTYAPAIFPDPQQTLSVLIQTTIDALVPSLSQRLSGLSEHYGASALPELIKAFRATEEFAVATDKVFEKVGYASLFSPQSLAPQMDDVFKSHSRRLSKRMSMSRRLGPARPSVSTNILASGGGAWEQVLFEPFIDFQTEFQSLEKKSLESTLTSVIDASRRATRLQDVDGARAFRERSLEVFSMAEESLGRCMDFTHGYGAVGMLHALDYIFSSFLNSSRAELLTSEQVASTIPGDAFEELDYSASDWRIIQLALHLLEACRVVRERLGVLETRLRTRLVQVASAFRLARGDPQGLYIPNTTRGEAQLLSQSTLNSVDLQTLLDKLDPGGMASLVGVQEMEQQTILLSGARNAIIEFTKACQRVLQDTLLAPMFHNLSTYATSSTWAATVDINKAGQDLIIPTFSLSPTPTIQRIAEGLLNLPRLFEVYAEDDALAFSVETLPFVDAESLRIALAPSPTPSPHPLSPGDSHMRRLSSSHTFNPMPSQQQQQTLPPEMVVSAWLSSLALSLLSHLTAKVLPAIRVLSTSGAAQLASDLEYLSNIVRALNVEWGELERWKEAVEMVEAVGRQKAKEEPGAEDIFNTVAKIRGWI